MMFRDLKFRKGRTAGKDMIAQFCEVIRQIDGIQGFATCKRIIFNDGKLIRELYVLKAPAFRESFRTNLADRLRQIHRYE